MQAEDQVQAQELINAMVNSQGSVPIGQILNQIENTDQEQVIFLDAIDSKPISEVIKHKCTDDLLIINFERDPVVA